MLRSHRNAGWRRRISLTRVMTGVIESAASRSRADWYFSGRVLLVLVAGRLVLEQLVAAVDAVAGHQRGGQDEAQEEGGGGRGAAAPTGCRACWAKLGRM